MAEGILNVLLGFISNKARDGMADHFKEGNPTETALRNILVRDLKNIKDKLKSLSTKDLLSAVDFCEMGVSTMKLEDDDRFSPKRAQTAEEYFNKAIEYSTQAFRNQSLATTKRIFAMKVHVSSLLLKLRHDPNLAFRLCLDLLKNLHEVPQVTKAFGSEYSGDTAKTSLFRRWRKRQRAEIIEGVKAINDAVGQFAALFDLQLENEWPVIQVVQENKEDVTFFFHRSVENLSDCPAFLRRKSWFEPRSGKIPKKLPRRARNKQPVIKEESNS